MPRRVVPQLHQPDGDAGAGGRRASTRQGRWACATRCSGPSTPSPATWACRARRSTTSRPGVNHLAFLLRLEHRGRDLYPDLRAFVEAGRVPDDDLVRAELFRRLGFYPTESSEHHAEYNPWFIPKGDAVERFHIPIGEYLSRVANNLDEYAETKRRLDAGEPFPIEQSGEYAAVIVHSLLTGRAGADRGQRDQPRGAHRRTSPPTPASRCPCLVDGTGVWPVAVGALPPQCAAYIGPAVDTQALTVRAALDEDRDAIYHAVMQDPQIQARLDLDQVWRLTDELIAAEARVAPRVARATSSRRGLTPQ